MPLSPIQGLHVRPLVRQRPSRKAFGQTKALSEGLLSEIDGKFPKQKRNFQRKFSLTKAENTGPLARDFSGQRPVRSRSEISMENCPETSSVRDEPTLHTFAVKSKGAESLFTWAKVFVSGESFFLEKKRKKDFAGKRRKTAINHNQELIMINQTSPKETNNILFNKK